MNDREFADRMRTRRGVIPSVPDPIDHAAIWAESWTTVDEALLPRAAGVHIEKALREPGSHDAEHRARFGEAVRIFLAHVRDCGGPAPVAVKYHAVSELVLIQWVPVPMGYVVAIPTTGYLGGISTWKLVHEGRAAVEYTDPWADPSRFGPAPMIRAIASAVVHRMKENL